MSNEKSPESVAQRFNEIKQEIAAKAFSDSTFRESLLADPRTTIVSEYGLPDEAVNNLNVTILEETPGVLTIPIPPSIDDIELSDEQLELVAGGGTPLLLSLYGTMLVATTAFSVTFLTEVQGNSW